VGLVGELLERAARATPSAVEDRATGWWLRHTDSAAWWSGAVLAHGPADGLAQRIAAAERFYAEQRVARFQVCSDCPDGLDRSLAERGYRLDAPISLLTATVDALSEVRPTPAISVHADTAPGPDWLAVLSATSAPGTDVDRETRLLGRVEGPQTYLTAHSDGEAVGIGRAVADAGWTGIFTMATVPRARRRGVARMVLSAIGCWARTRGAPQLYLQVEHANVAARRLYEAAGFTELAAYHYRVRPRAAEGGPACEDAQL
jgi:GNAT superfamily N-acetyltransferase